MLPDLRLGIKELLQQIIANKELDRHWQSKERENQKLMKATRRADRDRKRLEMGSEYCSDEEEDKFDCESDSEDDSDSYYDSECSDDGIEERDSELDHIIVNPSEDIQVQRQPASALGTVRVELDQTLVSKSALDGSNAMKDVNDITKTLGLTKGTRSFKSSKSRLSLAN